MSTAAVCAGILNATITAQIASNEQLIETDAARKAGATVVFQVPL